METGDVSRTIPLKDGVEIKHRFLQAKRGNKLEAT